MPLSYFRSPSFLKHLNLEFSGGVFFPVTDSKWSKEYVKFTRQVNLISMEVGQMSRVVRIVALTICAFFLFTIAVEVNAQRGGGGRYGGGRQEPVGGSPRQQMEIREQQRQQIRATDQQREQYRVAMRCLDRAMTRVRDMERLSKGPGSNMGQLREEQERLRNEFRSMEQEHHRFTERLSAEQREEFRHRLEEMGQIRERINGHLQAMDEEMNRPNPELKTIARRATEMEREMNAWQKRYREIGSEMGIKP